MMRSRLISALPLLLLCACTETPALHEEGTGTTPGEKTPALHEEGTGTTPGKKPSAKTFQSSRDRLIHKRPPLHQPQHIRPGEPAPFTLEREDPDNRVSSWRGNGRSRWDSPPPTTTWGTQTNVIWSTELPNWGNSSPVVYEDHVYVTVEPTTVVAMNRTTGRILWKQTNDYIDTLSGAARVQAKANQQQVQTLEDQIVKDQREVNRLRRDLRRANAPKSIEEKLEKLNQRLDSAQKKTKSLRRAETPDRGDIIGYASATLVASELGVFGVFGNGVVSRFDHNGERKWSLWLGESRPMRGYDWGNATSPLLINDVLIAAFGKLHGLDPLTGESRWVGPEWREFGNITLATVGGNRVLVTPQGTILRPRDGRVLSSKLPPLLYLGPTADGDRVYTAGNAVKENQSDRIRIAQAFQLLPDGPDHVIIQNLWKQSASADRYYSQPLVWDDRLWVVDQHCTLTTRSLKTGDELATVNLCQNKNCPPCYSSPVAAGKYAFFSIPNGYTLVIPAGGTDIQSVNFLAEGRANLVFDKDRIFIRSLNHLNAIGATE